MAQSAKIASVCCLCASSVAYSYHRVALFDKKKLARKDQHPGKTSIQERLASRISALSDITLNDDMAY